MIFRLIAPEWLRSKGAVNAFEGEFTEDEIQSRNAEGYNIFFFPNYPSQPSKGQYTDGPDIDIFRYVFVDMDLKDGVYSSKEQFIATLDITPTFIIDSGNGVHAYWQVTDLDANSYLRLQRRLCRKYNTDEAVGKIAQLMRVPDTLNTKDPTNFIPCIQTFESDNVYTCEDLDKQLPPISYEDEQYCQAHYNKTYNTNRNNIPATSTKIPLKFAKLVKSNKEVAEIWSGNSSDRSADDYRLGHIMFASGFTKEEAMQVLVNAAKALTRAPIHRLSYAQNIVDKIWIFEENKELSLSNSVFDILSKSGNALDGTRFPCYQYIDDTEKGMRLGHVVGLVAGVGVGKTALALNMFMGFVESNPDYDHFFVTLEQPDKEIAARWKLMCGENTTLHKKVQILGNYDESGAYRNLSLDEIREYVLKYQQVTGHKVGAIVIDHIGILKKKGKEGENQDLITICQSMKAFAIETNTLLIMQSQAPREKAGIGDLELNKDAAYGTMYFEAFCDYMITMWQPVKRCYKKGAPTVMAIKFCKIRHKNQVKDNHQEDTPYLLFFDPMTQNIRYLTQDEEKSFKFFNSQATNLRKQDRKTELIEYVSMKDDSGTA